MCDAQLQKESITFFCFPDINRTLDQVSSGQYSLAGLLGEIPIAEGALDDMALVSSIIPELSDSAFGNATVRQVSDMTTGLAYSENYSDAKADI